MYVCLGGIGNASARSFRIRYSSSKPFATASHTMVVAVCLCVSAWNFCFVEQESVACEAAEEEQCNNGSNRSFRLSLSQGERSSTSFLAVLENRRHHTHRPFSHRYSCCCFSITTLCATAHLFMTLANGQTCMNK